MNSFQSNIENIKKNECGIWFVPKIGDISFPSQESEISEQIDITSFWFIHRKKIILNLLKKLNRENNLHLDVGGGAGLFAYELQKLNSGTVWLIEPTNGGASAAKRRGVNNIINSTLDDLIFKKKISGNIYLLDVIEHIQNDIVFLQNLTSNLEINSHIIITVPTFSFLWSDKDTYFGHQRRYTLKDFKKIASDVGCEIIYDNYFFSFLFLPMLIRSILYKITHKKYSSQERLKEHGKRNLIIKSILFIITKIEIYFLEHKTHIPCGSSAVIILKKT